MRVRKKASFWALTFLLLLAAFLRLYRINEYATFLGDEGRDALVVKRMLVDGKPTLLGPSTSVGDLHLGPMYYYFMAPALWASHLHPVGPAVMVALFGVATVWLVWRVTRDFFGPKAGWMAGLLYAVSQPVIEHTRFSWNPNPMPFFALLAVWAVYRADLTKKGWWLAVAGACLGVVIQLHYLAFGLVAVVLALLAVLRPRVSRWWYAAFIGAGLLAVSPMVWFELRHDFLITHSLIRFLREDNKIGLTLVVLATRMAQGFWRLVFHFVAADKTWLAVLVLVWIGWWLKSVFKTRPITVARKVVLFWLAVGLAVAGLYTGDLHDHYLGFLFPVPFILVGTWFEHRGWRRFLGRGLFFILFLANIFRLDPVSGREPNHQIERSRQVGEAIARDVAEGESFNLALISPTLDFRAMNYRYFVEVYGRPAKGLDEYADLDTLYVIIEGEDLRPVGLTAWEIDTFGESELVDAWRFDFGYRVEKYQKRQGEE